MQIPSDLSQFLKRIIKAYVGATSMYMTIVGFNITDIVPYNLHIYSDDDFCNANNFYQNKSIASTIILVKWYVWREVDKMCKVF